MTQDDSFPPKVSPPRPIDRLLAVMARLRDPEGGCPWDLEQNFATIAPYTIEEAYEVADAIEQNDMAALRDELGDLLLQVVFHARMAEEAGHFAFDDVAGVEFIARRAREAKGVKVYTYAALTRNLEGSELTEMGLLAESGAVAFTDGLKPVADAQVMRRALAYAKTFGHLIVQHPEEPSLCGGGAMNGGELATRLGLPGIPKLAEVMMIERDLRLVEMTGGRYHVAHVSTAESVEAIRRAKDRGLDVTCDTAPHYFALNELAVGEYRTFAKVSPPLRSEDDRLAILEGVADGTIDAIASDHSPHDQESKRLPFANAEPGIVGLETLLPLSLQLYHWGKAGLLDLLAHLTVKPAEILGLDAGRLAKGAPADLLIFKPDLSWKIEPDSFESKSKNSPFEGLPVQGRVARTVVDGRALFEAA